MIRAVTFDYGQTLGELDMDFLSQRALEQGAVVDPARLEAASAGAWAAYDDAKRRGESGKAAWSTFMATLLRTAGAEPSDATNALVDYLWSEQPRRNLWRRPIPGMMELVQDLHERSVPLAIVSNSEGRLRELLEEVGLLRFFTVVADSGVLGFEKPDPRIFEHAADGLGVAAAELVHVGDAWVADIEGAIGVGAKAIWITTERERRTLPEAVAVALGAAEVRSALRGFGVPA